MVVVVTTSGSEELELKLKLLELELPDASPVMSKSSMLISWASSVPVEITVVDELKSELDAPPVV